MVLLALGCGCAATRPSAQTTSEKPPITIAVIPHTAEVTTLGTKGAGDRVNLEVDLVAKYVEQLLAAREG